MKLIVYLVAGWAAGMVASGWLFSRCPGQHITIPVGYALVIGGACGACWLHNIIHR